MSKIIFKGGPWSNKEDALLLAAQAKYGLQNWDRIASMLDNRKTPQQCKDRWFQYLDPTINKGEWSADEEEKLVELSEAFSGRWELIAMQLKGRRPWQCEEHYRALIDSLQGGGGGTTTAPDALIAELRTRRMQSAASGGPAGGGAGGGGMGASFDAAFETRAPRADTSDMDHREEEMVATAIARLGNQELKKEGRFARQQQLKETTFLTTLQRGREMEESGTLSEKMRAERAAAMKASGRPVDDENSEYDEANSGEFVPLEVEQSAARKQKKNNKLLLHGNTLENEEENKTGNSGIDVSYLFGSSTSEVDALKRSQQRAASANSSLLSWDSLSAPVVPSSSSTSVRAAPLAVITKSTMTKTTTGVNEHDDIQTLKVAASLSFTADELRRAAEAIDHECESPSAVDTEWLEKSVILLAPLKASSIVKVITRQDLSQAIMTKHNERKKRQRDDGDAFVPEDEQSLRAMHDELNVELDTQRHLSAALHFYRSVCTEAEEKEMNWRRSSSTSALHRIQEQERHLQDALRERQRQAA